MRIVLTQILKEVPYSYHLILVAMKATVKNVSENSVKYKYCIENPPQHFSKAYFLVFNTVQTEIIKVSEHIYCKYVCR